MTAASPVLPWQKDLWARLTSLQRQRGLGHALLLDGPRGWGKRFLARQLARELLGRSPRGEGGDAEWGDDASDTDLLAHPDFRLVTRVPGEPGGRVRTQIAVDQIRELNGFLAQTSQSGGARVVVIELAEELNVAASNALLKGLEEPGARTWLLLVTHAGGRLLATIRSRCQRVVVKPGTWVEALDWLAARSRAERPETLLDLAGGAPLLALEYEAAGAEVVATRLAAALDGTASPTDVAQQCARAETVLVLDLFYRLCALRARRAAEAGGDLTAALRLVERVAEGRRAAGAQGNPNLTLLLEDCLLGWRQLVSRGGH